MDTSGEKEDETRPAEVATAVPVAATPATATTGKQRPIQPEKIMMEDKGAGTELKSFITNMNELNTKKCYGVAPYKLEPDGKLISTDMLRFVGYYISGKKDPLYARFCYKHKIRGKYWTKKFVNNVNKNQFGFLELGCEVPASKLPPENVDRRPERAKARGVGGRTTRRRRRRLHTTMKSTHRRKKSPRIL